MLSTRRLVTVLKGHPKKEMTTFLSFTEIKHLIKHTTDYGNPSDYHSVVDFETKFEFLGKTDKELKMYELLVKGLENGNSTT